MKIVKSLIICALAVAILTASLMMSSCNSSSVKITDENVIDVMSDLLPNAYAAYRNTLFGKYKVDESAASQTFNDCTYLPVSDADFNTLDKVKSNCREYYTEKYANTYIFTALNGDTPVYKEFDGKLYLNVDGGGDGGYNYSTKSAKLQSSTDNGCVVTVDCIDNYEVSYTATLTFVYENGKPKIDAADYAEK